MLNIPEYVPIPSSMQHHFETKLKDASIPVTDLKQTENDLLQAAVEFLDQIVETEDTAGTGEEEEVDRLAPLKRLLESFETLVQTQQQTRDFQNIFIETKTAVRERSRREGELEIDQLEHFSQLDPDQFLFSRMLESKMSTAQPVNIQRQFGDNADYIYLKNAAFILEHPEDPLPDENDDDDLHVEGGKIDLRCPITLKLFENPLTSTECHHTFDQEGVEGTWISQQDIHSCPIPGCSKALRRTDFQPDRLMNLRVKCYKRLQQKQHDKHYERV